MPSVAARMPKRPTNWKARSAPAVAQSPKVAADFAALDYISSAGLRAVLQAARAAQAANVEFAVCGLSAPVQKVFTMSGMQHILRIHGELPC